MTDPLGPCAHFAVVLRSPHVEDGLAARLADPLWMLARQWQLGEFRGDDAGSLVSLNFEADAYAPTWWRPEPDAEHATAQPWQSWTVRTGPLEATIDAERDDGSAWLRLCIDGGVAARRALCAAGLGSVAAPRGGHVAALGDTPGCQPAGSAAGGQRRLRCRARRDHRTLG